MAKKTDYLQMDKPYLTEAADIDVLNGNFDKIDGEFKKISGRMRKNVAYISESQNWTVPSGVTKIDVFIVDGGYDGEVGKKPSSSSNNQIAGGAGGKGGACVYYGNLTVSPGQVFSVVVGAANGGKTSFGTLAIKNIDCAAGGSGGTYQTSSIPLQKGSLPLVNGVVSGFCPIDGKYYGVSGAGGAVLGGTTRDGGDIVCLGGTAGKDNDDNLPTGGVYNRTGVTVSVVWSGGGGASYDNDGEDAVSQTVGGAGGAAVSYGCGGGGGGAGTYEGTAGAGGTGAPGGVIIGY